MRSVFSGSAFLILAETGNARLPIVGSLEDAIDSKSGCR